MSIADAQIRAERKKPAATRLAVMADWRPSLQRPMQQSTKTSRPGTRRAYSGWAVRYRGLDIE
jgi:hypothetical protein